MILESALWVTSILFFVGGFIIASAKGVRGRAYIFIFILTVIYLMFGVFSGDVAWKYGKPTNYDSMSYSARNLTMEQIKGTAVFIVGMFGLVLLTQFRGIKTEELGYVFGIGGAIQLVSGLIAMISGEAIELKFFVTLVALVLS